LYYAKGVGDAAYKGNVFTFVVLSGNVIEEDANGTVIRTLKVSPDEAFAVTMSPDGKEFVVCHGVCSAYTAEGKKLWTFKDVKAVTNNPAWVGSTVFVPDAGSMTLYALNAKTGKLLYEKKYDEPVYAVTACGDRVAVGVGSSVYLYSFEKGYLQKLGEAKLGKPINDIAFSPDCNLLLVASGTRIYTLDFKGKVVGEADMGALVSALAWNGKYVAIYTLDSAGLARVQLFEATISYSAPKTRYVLNFTKLTGVTRVIPLTYPSPEGVVYLLAQTGPGAYQIWTLVNGKVVGKLNLPKGTIVFVPDVRAGEVATYHGKLLVQVNTTLYAVYGNKMEKLLSLYTKSALATFAKVGNKIYAIEANLTKGKEYNVVTCSYKDLSNNVLKTFKFRVPNDARVGIVADTLDAEGCAVLWAKPAVPKVWYEYEGVNGSANGTIDLTNATAGFGVMFVEVRKGETHPYIAVARGTDNGVVFELHDALTGKKLSVKLPKLFSVIGVGDYLGEGYYGDVAITAFNVTKTYLYVLNTKNVVRKFYLGEIGRSVAIVRGLAYHEGYTKNVFGLGNFVGPTVDVVTNVGTLKFAVRGITVAPSTLDILLTLTKSKMCYTAIINPLSAGNVYLATACVPR
jgi:outer membrane protein assembly factor BamB